MHDRLLELAVRTVARPAHPARAPGLQRLTPCADLVRVGMLCLAAILLAAGDGPAALKALLVLCPAVLARLVRVHPGFDLLFTLALAAEAIGTALGFYDAIGWGDTLSHLVLPLLGGSILYVGLVRLDAVAEPTAAATDRFLVGAVAITAITVLGVGAMWELVECAADAMLGTEYSQGYEDTLVDLLADAIAAVGGGVLVAIWLRAGPGPHEGAV